jgi:hypothetical protein
MSGSSGVTFSSLAQSLANLPPGTNLVTSDGTPVILDSNQQLVIQTTSGDEGSPTKESSAEHQLRTFWQRQTEKIRAMKAVSSALID